jgi:GGDEF domain-containing protein
MEISDSYGHREGDLALIRAADALERTFRGSDILARMGGDEFAVLALEACSENLQVILRRLEGSLKQSKAQEFGYDLSLSVGVARFDPKNPVSLGELMARADQDMYEQKRKKQKIDGAPQNDASGPGYMPLDGRTEKRAPMAMAMNLVSAQDQLVTERVLTENVSSHGVRVLTKRYRQPGEPARLIPLKGESGFPARVVYCQS